MMHASTEPNATDVLHYALASFGPRGERWAPRAGACALVAIYATAAPTEIQRAAARALRQVIGEGIPRWNDSATFAEVRKAFEGAAEFSERARLAAAVVRYLVAIGLVAMAPPQKRRAVA